METSNRKPPAESACSHLRAQELNQMITDMEVWLKDRALG